MKENKPIDVNGKITPITKQVIQDVRADKWSQMSTNDRFVQKLILESRLSTAAQLGNFPLIQQIQMGIEQIHAIIRARTDSETRLI